MRVLTGIDRAWLRRHVCVCSERGLRAEVSRLWVVYLLKLADRENIFTFCHGSETLIQPELFDISIHADLTSMVSEGVCRA